MITLFGVSGGDSDHTLNNFSIISKYSSSLKFEIIENNYNVVILNSKNLEM
jgi:thiamine pyrophosphokinase